MRPLLLGTLTALTLGLVATSAPAVAHHPAPVVHAKAKAPALAVKKLVTGLDHPWDVRPISGGRLIFTQRDRATVSIWDDGDVRTVGNFPTDSVWVSGETGLMGLETDPKFGTNHRFYTCQGGTTEGGGHEVKVMAWTLNDELTSITGSKRLVGGFPTSSGRHGGCRLLALDDGSLYVGTGDAAQGSNPENKKSLGGKTLRLDAKTGKPWPTNPFIRSGNARQRYVQTYGHRNVQGLALRKGGGVYSVEQGTYRDDEVNQLVSGGDHGYDPRPDDGGPGYDESVPMTDQSLPGDQVEAAWSSGDPTLATSGATFVQGRRWGRLRGTLAVAVLKAEEVLFLSFDRAGRLRGQRAPVALRRLGRIRTVVQDRDGSLLVTTDDGGGRDALYRVRPGR